MTSHLDDVTPVLPVAPLKDPGVHAVHWLCPVLAAVELPLGHSEQAAVPENEPVINLVILLRCFEACKF